MTIDTSRRANIRGYFGASGTGKSWAAKEWLRGRRADRLLIFDPENEYESHARQVTAPELLAGLKAGIPRGAFRLRYVPPWTGRAELFDAFCRLALLAAERAGGCVVVVDELAEVTGQGKAINGWGTLVRTGRKRGVELVACSIRPAEIDKTFWSQCTYVRAGRLTEADADRVAKVLALPPAELTGLADLDYRERDLQGAGVASGGTIRPAGRSKKTRAG